MKRESFEDLANAALEGSATPEQRAALGAWLEGDPKSRERWNTLQLAFEALARAHPVAPPPELKGAIMQRIHAEQAARRAAPHTGPGLHRAPALRFASVFAAGFAAGILIWTLVPGSHVATHRNLPASGTMLPPTGSLRPLGRMTLDAGTAQALIETRGSPASVEAQITARAATTGQMILEFDSALEPQALDPILVGVQQVSFAPGRVTLEFTGDLRCTIRLHGTNADKRSIRVVVRSGNGTAEGALDKS